MESKTFHFRVMGELRAAAEAKAKEAGLSVEMWMRSLVEKATGVMANPKQGALSLTPKERKAAAKHAAETRWAKEAAMMPEERMKAFQAREEKKKKVLAEKAAKMAEAINERAGKTK